MTSVSRLFLFVSSTFLAAGQSHPAWWTFVSPDARSLVGIEWGKLGGSPFGDALHAQIFGAASETQEATTESGLGFPDLPCLINSREFLISSAPLLAAANGGCTAGVLRDQANARGMKPVGYRGFTIWMAAGTSVLGLAQFSEQVTLIGSRKSVEAAIDRNVNRSLEKNPDSTDRHYSTLLIPGARLGHTRDLWVVASELPDPLASLFVPLDLTGRNFEGGVSARDGLDLGAIFDTASEKAARQVAAGIRESIPSLPAVAKGIEVVPNGSSVVLALSVTAPDLMASLRRPAAQDGVDRPSSGALQAVEVVSRDPVQGVSAKADPVQGASVKPHPVQRVLVERTAEQAPKPAPVRKPMPVPNAAPTSDVSLLPAVSPAVPAPKLAPDPKPVPEKAEPQVIRIYGLDGGTREIVLPPKEPR